MGCDLLFVYGTLLMGIDNPVSDYVEKFCRFFARGRFKGELFEVDGYPGAQLVPNCDSFVYGDILKLLEPDIAFHLLDHYEMIGPQFPEPHEYVRDVIPISIIDPDNLNKSPVIPRKYMDCWVYLYNWNTSGLRRIPGGDYREFRN
jgi:gamma-glutamylcyclotransferase (GGCT)/AIG2-like uncharacterized protein YtfP